MRVKSGILSKQIYYAGFILKRFTKPLLVFLALSLFCTLPSSALEMSPRRLKHTRKIIRKVLSQLLHLVNKEKLNPLDVTLDGKTFENFEIAKCNVSIHNLNERTIKKSIQNQLSFFNYKESFWLEASGFITQTEIQKLIDREITRLRPEYRIFSDVKIQIDKNSSNIQGKVKLDKIPGNFMAFLSPAPAPFNVNVKVQASSESLTIEILDGQLNGQPITDSLRQQLHGWLNPLWDFAGADFSSSIDALTFEKGEIHFAGTLFK